MIPGGSQGNVNRKFACDQNDHRSKNRILYRQARAAIGLIVAEEPEQAFSAVFMLQKSLL